jgi:hypothetical protein
LVLGNDLPSFPDVYSNEAPEDIVDEQDHSLRPKGFPDISLPNPRLQRRHRLRRKRRIKQQLRLLLSAQEIRNEMNAFRQHYRQ